MSDPTCGTCCWFAADKNQWWYKEMNKRFRNPKAGRCKLMDELPSSITVEDAATYTDNDACPAWTKIAP